MKSNVDYVVCPECDALNAATWSPRGRRSYDVTCSVCGYEYEHGHYESARNLTFEQFLREQQQSSQVEQDLADYAGLQHVGDRLTDYLDCYRDDDNDAYQTMIDYGLLS